MSLEAAAFTDLAAALGQAATLRTTARGTYNPATDAFAGDATTNTAGTAILQNRVRRYENGRLVTVEGLSATIPAAGLAVTPVEGDLLIVGADTYRIRTVHARRAAGTVLVYSCELEG